MISLGSELLPPHKIGLAWHRVPYTTACQNLFSIDMWNIGCPAEILGGRASLYATSATHSCTSNSTIYLGLNFELMPVMFEMRQSVGQFNGLSTEDPHMYLLNFVAICNSYKQHRVAEDGIRLRLFLFSLNGIARPWLNSLELNLIPTWDEMARKFILKYFPLSKIVQFRNDIYVTLQIDNEFILWHLEKIQRLIEEASISWYSSLGANPNILP